MLGHKTWIRGGVLERYFSRESTPLQPILKAQPVSSVLPLSGSEGPILLPAAGVLVWLTWVVLDRVRQR